VDLSFGSFERMSPSRGHDVLTELYGIHASELTPLDTERDDSFRVEADEGRFVLKVAHPDDSPALVDLQTRALLHVASADPGLPVQSVRPSLDGTLEPVVDGRVTRVLSWIDGTLMSEHSLTAEHLFACGRALGRVSAALAEFQHPAARRELNWDLKRLPSMRRVTTDPVLLGVIDRFDAEVSPALERMPHQVIHNDFHPGNVLVDPSLPDFVSGILDFGDVVYTARVCDLGIAIAYLVPEDVPFERALTRLVDGFESVVPLSADERAVLPDLVAARLVLRILIPAMMEPQRDLSTFVARNTRMLHAVLENRN
jgi:hydroxylysine kinase